MSEEDEAHTMFMVKQAQKQAHGKSRIDMWRTLILIFVLFSCNFLEQKNKSQTGIVLEKSESGFSDTFESSNLNSDSQNIDRPNQDYQYLDSILYFKKNKLNSNKIRHPFSYTERYDKSKQQIFIESNNFFPGIFVSYMLQLEIKEKFDLDKNKFSWYLTETYKVTKIALAINKDTLDMTNSNFINRKSKSIYPAGLWHWSNEENPGKYYKYGEKEVILLQGTNLECNGSQCTDFQLIVIVRDDLGVSVNSFYVSGVYPYLFDFIHLLDIENDGIPELYINKYEKNELKNINDFKLYSINSSRKIIELSIK